MQYGDDNNVTAEFWGLHSSFQFNQVKGATVEVRELILSLSLLQYYVRVRNLQVGWQFIQR